jgi:hypothetical protein
MSFAKIALLVAIVALIWFGFRWLSRRDAAARAAPPPADRLGRAEGGQAQDLIACAKCGVFVATGASSCGKAGCPY